MPKKIAVIILAGGKGTRFSKTKPKQFYKIDNETILEINIKKFQKFSFIQQIIVISEKSLIPKAKRIASKYDALVVNGGKTRQSSVLKGLQSLEKYEPNYVIVHDCARPFFHESMIKNFMKYVSNETCIIPVLKVSDSIIKISESVETCEIDRTGLFLIQTPQIFPFKKIFSAHINTKRLNYTDDSAIARDYNLDIKTIEGSKKNIKITTKDDITSYIVNNKNKNFTIRVGNGFDVHAFEKGNKLIICGVEIPFTKKLKGHSDADVGFHSIVDAILGSIGEGDIGDHFPPSEKKWKDVSSEIFMRFAKKLLENKQARIQNIDLTIICENPKLFKYKVLMKKNISQIMNVPNHFVNVKATTTEKLGFIGREQGIAAQATVTTKILDAIKN